MEHYGTRLAIQRNGMVRGYIDKARRTTSKAVTYRNMERQLWDRQIERECQKALRAIHGMFRIVPH